MQESSIAKLCCLFLRLYYSDKGKDDVSKLNHIYFVSYPQIISMHLKFIPTYLNHETGREETRV